MSVRVLALTGLALLSSGFSLSSGKEGRPYFTADNIGCGTGDYRRQINMFNVYLAYKSWLGGNTYY